MSDPYTNEPMTAGKLIEILGALDSSFPVVLSGPDSYLNVGVILPDDEYRFVTIVPGWSVSV